MKKLRKKIKKLDSHTIEAYAITSQVGCLCNCTCDCSNDPGYDNTIGYDVRDSSDFPTTFS